MLAAYMLTWIFPGPRKLTWALGACGPEDRPAPQPRTRAAIRLP